LKVFEGATEVIGTYYDNGKYQGKYARTMEMLVFIHLMGIKSLHLVAAG